MDNLKEKENYKENLLKMNSTKRDTEKLVQNQLNQMIPGQKFLIGVNQRFQKYFGRNFFNWCNPMVSQNKQRKWLQLRSKRDFTKITCGT